MVLHHEQAHIHQTRDRRNAQILIPFTRPHEIFATMELLGMLQEEVSHLHTGISVFPPGVQSRAKEYQKDHDERHHDKVEHASNDEPATKEQ